MISITTNAFKISKWTLTAAICIKQLPLELELRKVIFLLSNGIKILRPGIPLKQFVNCGNIDHGLHLQLCLSIHGGNSDDDAGELLVVYSSTVCGYTNTTKFTWCG